MADNREKLIKDILACNTGLDETDLVGASEPLLTKILTREKAKATPPPPVPSTTPAQVPQVITGKDWLVNNNAPPQLHQMYDSYVAQHAALVANILAMPNNKITQPALQQMDLMNLQAMREMLTPVPQQVQMVGNGMGGFAGLPSYAGQNIGVGNTGQKGPPPPLNPIDPFAPPAKK